MQWMLTHSVKSGCRNRRQYKEKTAGSAEPAENPSLMDADTTMESGSASDVESGPTLFTMSPNKDAKPADRETFPTPTSRDWKDGPGMSFVGKCLRQLRSLGAFFRLFSPSKTRITNQNNEDTRTN